MNSISPQVEGEDDVQATISHTLLYPSSQPQLPTSIELISYVMYSLFYMSRRIRTRGECLDINLPRCGHIFHLECIAPLLTEHEETCPLRKLPLFDPSMDLA